MLFWDVDTQIDFLSPGGRLYFAGSERIAPNLRRLTAWAGEQHVLVISTACAHRPGDPELEIYGEHCMAGTPGQQKLPETLLPNRFVIPNRPITLPDLRSFQQVILEKQAFDFSSNPNCSAMLAQLRPPLDIVVYGVATDICVAAAARALLKLGNTVSLVHDAVAELDAQKAGEFLREFVSDGGRLVSASDVIGRPAEHRVVK